MSVATRSSVFLALTFGIGWTALILSWMQGARTPSDIAVAGIMNVFSPAISALVCSVSFERGQRLAVLGLKFRPNWSWLWAALIPLALSVITVFLGAPERPFILRGADHTAGQLAAAFGQGYTDPAAYLLRVAPLAPLAILASVIFSTLSEEVGWRGYLYQLWRSFGFWRYSIAVGVIWGVWHWPLIFLFGMNYPEHRVLGLIVFPIATTLLAVLMTLVRDRGGSAWAPGILHGVWNALSIAAAITFVRKDSWWTGLGLNALAALAAGVLGIAFLRRVMPGTAHSETLTEEGVRR